MNKLKDIVTSLFAKDLINDENQFPSTVSTYCIPREMFKEAAKVMKKSGARLVAEWATDETLFGRDFGVYACYAKDFEYLIIKITVPEEDPTFPSITKKYIAANRFERQMNSLMGVIPEGHPDLRPWIMHEDWPVDTWPLRKSFNEADKIGRVDGEYKWIRAEGEGVYEIPVGPVHAGIIEPGHFRFHAVGEEIINLEERLGYVHKGIEKRFESLSWENGVKLSGRVSGDSTVAHSIAYCRAVESMTSCNPPNRGLWLRGLMLERERIANHLGDIGAICNDAAFAFLLYQFSRLKENILRTNHKLFGHRFMMDKIIIGGVNVDIKPDAKDEILSEMDNLEKEFKRLVKIYNENPSLEDRVKETGILSTETARDLCVVGYVARASELNLDSRIQSPFPPYDLIVPNVPVYKTGDVHGRVWVRTKEIRDSVRIIREIINRIPDGDFAITSNIPPPDSSGFAVVEGWRGEIVYWVQSGPKGEINRCMVRDPSSVNWLALEKAIHGNIVPDFPLCNKSFNQSYSGHDL